jgi:hypothetical protein
MNSHAMNTYEVFRGFYTEEEAAGIYNLLMKSGIDAKVEKKRPIADTSIVGHDSDHNVFIKIKNSDFTKANELIDSYIELNLSAIDSDYYLYGFTNEELFDIIKKPDEWNNQDFIIAKKILAERGYNLSETEVKNLTQTRLTELEKPEKISFSGIFVGYVTAMFGIIGLIFGLILVNSKKVLPNGRKAFVYDTWTRGHGKSMIIIGAIMTVFGVATTIMTNAIRL